MKTGVFVEKLSNVTRFADATRTLEKRGAREACWLLVEGEPGFGKTRTLIWFAAQHRHVFVRAKADYTPSWMLRDLAVALGVQPMHRTQSLFDAVGAELLTRGCPSIVVDEIDHAARSVRVLETLRDLTDMTECPLIAGGMKGAEAALKRYPQIHSRIAEIVEFGPASAADVQTICGELSDCRIADDLSNRIQTVTQGRLRLVMNAIARVEAFGRKGKGEVTLADWGGRPLLNSDRGRAHLQVLEAGRG